MDTTTPAGTFPELLIQRGLTPADVVRAVHLSESDIYKVLAGTIPVRERGYRGQPSQLVLLATFFDMSPDKIKTISRSTVDWKDSMERNDPCSTEPT